MLSAIRTKIERLIRAIRVPRCESPFVVIFRERSGSTHLCAILNHHPEILCYHENFSLERVDPDNVPEGIEPVYYQRSHYLRQIQRFEQCIENPSSRQIVQHVHDIFSCPRKACGFKFKYSIQFAIFPEVLEELRYVNRTLRIILLHRRNTLKQAISRKNMERIKAASHGCSNLINYEDSPSKDTSQKLTWPFRFDVKSVVDHAIRLLEEEQAFFDSVDLIRGPGTQILNVFYEDLLEDQEMVAKQVFEFLGVDRDGHIESAVQKATPDELSLAVENYEELKAAVQGTELEKFL